ncbi:MAG TPA: hypothetical protein VKB09_02980 [Thermomicrobiales bacterium]|nr:hypothetical protein [Thermomicrobiales bacterium]
MPHVSSPALVGRAKHLLDLHGLTDHLERIAAYDADDEALSVYHTSEYLVRVAELDRTGDELRYAVMMADWNIGKTGITSYGVTLTFRYKYTSDFPGVVTRDVSGTDRADAMRKFLAQLKEEPAS